jgi:hypothetical protein
MLAAARTGEDMDLENLPDYWWEIAQEFNRHENLPPLAANRVLSARAFDESQTAGPRTYMEAQRYLAVARDNHEALLALLEHRGATLWAPWSLLRPTFEASFRAAWILDPEDGRERRVRGLRCEVLDAYEQRRHRGALKKIPNEELRELIRAGEAEAEAEGGALSTYRAEAAALGRAFDTLHQKIDVIAELPKLSFLKALSDFGPFLEAIWRQLSGFEHGLGWALLSGTDRKTEVPVPGGAGLHLVIKDEAFVNAAKFSYFLLLSACRLFTRLHLEPSRS